MTGILQSNMMFQYFEKKLIGDSVKSVKSHNSVVLVRCYLVRILERVDSSQAILIRNIYILHDNVTILHHPQPNLILDFGSSVTWRPFLHNKPTRPEDIHQKKPLIPIHQKAHLEVIGDTQAQQGFISA